MEKLIPDFLTNSIMDSLRWVLAIFPQSLLPPSQPASVGHQLLFCVVILLFQLNLPSLIFNIEPVSDTLTFGPSQKKCLPVLNETCRPDFSCESVSWLVSAWFKVLVHLLIAVECGNGEWHSSWPHSAWVCDPVSLVRHLEWVSQQWGSVPLLQCIRSPVLLANLSSICLNISEPFLLLNKVCLYKSSFHSTLMALCLMTSWCHFTFKWWHLFMYCKQIVLAFQKRFNFLLCYSWSKLSYTKEIHTLS